MSNFRVHINSNISTRMVKENKIAFLYENEIDKQFR